MCCVLQSLSIVFNGPLTRTATDNGTGAAKVVQGFALEVSGPIMPDCLWRLCEVLKTTQTSGFELQCKSDPATLGFNANVTTAGRGQEQPPAAASASIGLHLARRLQLERVCGIASVQYTPINGYSFTTRSI